MIRIEIVLPDSSRLIQEYENGVTPERIAEDFSDRLTSDILSCRIDNIHERLDTKIEKDCTLQLLDQKNPYANLVYQTSLTLLYLRAIHDVFGEKTRVSINNSLSRGLFTNIHVPTVTDEDCAAIAKRMESYVKRNEPIGEKRLSREKAIAYLSDASRTDQLKLFESAPDLDGAYLCTLAGEEMLFYMHAVTNCSYLKRFEIRKYRSGVLLRFPHHRDPSSIPAYEEQKILYEAFSEETHWERLCGINSAVDLNRCVSEGGERDLILLCEALHEKKIAEIAEKIHHSGKRIILIAGPSSSGKTSFARRLCIQLRVIGIHPMYLGTDDYFINRDDMEVDEKGNRDYESLSAVDTALFSSQMNDLLSGKKVDLPEFDFINGVKVFGKRITSIRKDQLIVIEGIHALNPKLSEGIDEKDKFRIYISPLTQLNIDAHHRIPTTDARLFRRLVRDHATRGRSAATTIHDWPAVRHGEDDNIFPYNSEADAFFNSHCIYELAVLKKYAEPLLKEITPDMAEYPEAQRYLQYLKFFVPLKDEDAIACNSILREFIGGSVLTG